MIQICREAGPGETYREDAPEAVQFMDTPVAIYPDRRLIHNTGTTETSWIPIHIPSGRCIGNYGWFKSQSAMQALSEWWSQLDADSQHLLRVVPIWTVACECWDLVKPLFELADFELQID